MNKISVACRGDRIYRFSPAATALLAIDYQQEFIVEGTGECLDQMQAVVPRTTRLVGPARGLGCRLIHARESYRPDLSDVGACRHSLENLADMA